MIESISEKQPVIFNMINNIINNNCLSHAYLIDLNNELNSLDIVISFVKTIICQKKENLKNKNCNKCLDCKLIDMGNHPDFKILEPENNLIKKNQIIDLQNYFSTKSLEKNQRVYLIKDCDKMNIQASNSLLKFLEEPSENIVAILTTNNINNVIPTIKSRCQNIKFKRNIISRDSTIKSLAYFFTKNEKEYVDFINSQEIKNQIDDAINFLCFVEKNKESSIIYLKTLLGKYMIKDKDNLTKTVKEINIFLVEIMLYFYYDVLNMIIKKDNSIFYDYSDKLKIVVSRNNLETVIKKINILLINCEKIRYNVNINLLYDKLIIDLGEI